VRVRRGWIARLLFAFVAVLVALVLPRPAEAGVEPPKAVDTPAPPAPESALIAPVLIVELVVSRTGEVTSSKVVSGDPTLAPALEEAALAWRFEPARREGVPVPAKIRMRVELPLPRLSIPATASEPPATAGQASTSPVGVAPHPSLPNAAAIEKGAPNSPSSATVLPPAAADEAPEEVRVRGMRPLAPHVELIAAEIREMPGAFGDAFRAIEALPGVVPVLSGIPYFVIRGAPPGNTGYYLDDIRVPALFHFAIGEAVIHPALVESVNLYPAVYPARFGRYAGGILSGDTVPEAEKLHGNVAVRLLDAGALLETPFAHGRGDALVSGRVGYPGLLLSVFDPDVRLQYYDYQARASYRFEDGSELRLFGFGSYDSLAARQVAGGPIQPLVGIQFERLSLRYTAPAGEHGEARVEATVGHDETSTGTSPPISLSSEMVSLRSEYVTRPSDFLAVGAGVDVVLEPYLFNLAAINSDNPLGASLLGAYLPTRQDDLTAGIYGDLGMKLSRRVDADFGLRGDLFTATYPDQTSANPETRARQVGTLDPRLTVKYKMTRALTWISAIGMAHQPSNIPLPVPAVSFSQLSRGIQTAYQASEGVEAKLPWGFSGTATVFGNDFTGLAQLSNNCPNGINGTPSTSCAGVTVDGRAYGLELLVRRNLSERLTGWISLTLSRSERYYFDGMTQRWGYAVSEYDRPAVGNLIVAYDLGAHWRAGVRVLGYAGSPYSTNSLDGLPNARTPPFVRLDLRLEKRWNKSWGYIAFIAEWLNALLQKEQFGLTCIDSGTTHCTPALVGPITVPSLGGEAAF
jgi:hypothetical protein